MNTGRGGGASGSSFRTWLNSWSFPVMARLHAMPRWVLPLVTAGLLLLGLIAPPQWLALGVVAMVLVTLWVIWLVTLSWPLLGGFAKWIRVAMIGLLISATILRAMGRL